MELSRFMKTIRKFNNEKNKLKKCRYINRIDDIIVNRE